jgi:ATP/maltotriose-dependent transcriptional regulator MalT
MKVRIEGAGEEVEALRSRAEKEGLVLARSDEEADLIARGVRSSGQDSFHASAAPSAGRARKNGPAAAGPSPILSPRELEIVEYLADGWSNAEIASALRIGGRTVRFHLEGIYGKLGVSRRGEAVREALSLGLVRFEV